MGSQIGKILLSEKAIGKRVAELAEKISQDYQDKGQILLVGVLRGAFIFLSDLARRLTIPNQIDFIALASYDETTEATGAVRLVMDLRTEVVDRHVLIIEDIVDTGYTLQYLSNVLATRRPASLKCCALVRKRGALKVDLDLDYLGFDIPDVWVVGYGLDCLDQFRTLPYIAAIDPQSIDRATSNRR